MSGYSRRPIIKIGFMNLFGILTAKRLWEVSHGKNDGSSIKILSYIGTALDRYIENLRNLPNLIFVCLGAIAIFVIFKSKNSITVRYKRTVTVIGIILFFVGAYKTFDMESQMETFNKSWDDKVHITGEIMHKRSKRDKFTGKMNEMEYLIKVYRSIQMIEEKNANKKENDKINNPDKMRNKIENKSDIESEYESNVARGMLILCNLKTSQRSAKKEIRKMGNRKFDNMELKIGDVVRIDIAKKKLETDRLPNTFHYDEYLKFRGVAGNVDIENISIEKRNYGILQKVKNVTIDYLMNTGERIKREFSDFLRNNLGGIGIVESIVFGDKSNLTKEEYEKFQKNGVAPILATSGLHLGFVYAILKLLFRKKRTAVKSFFILVIVFVYMAMCGFTLSITRSGIMIFVGVVQEHLKMRRDLTSMAMAALIIQTYCCPMCIFATDFQLSYLAVFIISQIMNLLNIFMRKTVVNTLIKGLLLSVILQSLMMPVTAYYFNYFPVSGYLANIFLTAIGGFILVLGILGVGSFAIMQSEVMICIGKIFKISPAIKNRLCDFWTSTTDYFVMLFSDVNQGIYANGKFLAEIRSPSLLWVVAFYSMLFYFSSEGFLWKISRAGIFVAHNSTETKLYNTVESIEKISNERRDKAYMCNNRIAKFQKVFSRMIIHGIAKTFVVAMAIALIYKGIPVGHGEVGGVFKGEQWLLSSEISNNNCLIIKSENEHVDKSTLEHLNAFLLKNEKGRIDETILLCRNETAAVYASYLFKRNENMKIFVREFKGVTAKKYNLKSDSLNELKGRNKRKAMERLKAYFTER